MTGQDSCNVGVTLVNWVKYWTVQDVIGWEGQVL